MQAIAQRVNPVQIPPQAFLGLDKEPIGPKHQNKFFFASQLTSQRLAILKNMVGGRSLVIMVTGECGSGKTTLMNQFIANAGKLWCAGRIRLKSRFHSSSSMWRHLNNRMVFISRHVNRPSVIIDDAHQLSPKEIKTLFQWAFSSNGGRRLQSIVLLAEPQMRHRYAEIANYLPPGSVIDKIDMTPLTEKQTADYLHHRIKAAGYSKTNLFTEDQIRTIHQLSSGLPGCINKEAYKLIKQMKDHSSNKVAIGRRKIIHPWKKKLLDKLSLTLKIY